MTPEYRRDSVLEDLARLRPLAPGAARASRVRARCRARLVPADGGSPPARLGRRVFVPIVVLAVCALLLSSLVGTVLRVSLH